VALTCSDASHTLGTPVNNIVRLLVGSVLLGSRLPAQATPPASAKVVAISVPRPEYPYEARRNHITGRGTVVIYVDPKSGIVTRAVMAQSTGSWILDNAALSAFRRWRFKPGTVSMVRTPINFSMDAGPSISFDPNRSYSYGGTVKVVNTQAATITVQGPRGTDTIAITPTTQLSKNGNAVTLRKVAVGDYVRGQARVIPDRRAVAISAIIKSSPR
jgi:TonB family protein